MAKKALFYPTYKNIGHVVLSIIMLAMSVVDAPTPRPADIMFTDNPFFPTDFILHALCVGFGFLNYTVLIPKVLYRRNWIFYGLLVFAIFLAFCTVPELLSGTSFFPFLYLEDDVNIHSVIQIRHIFFLFFCVLLYTLTTRIEERRHLIQQELDQAELKFLRAQINPHFLFNTLNSIYALQQVNTESAGESIISLSNIMRYIIDVSEEQKVSLLQEVGYVDDFITLQRNRFGKTADIRYYRDIEQSQLMIPPLLLVPFVENAFKYGIHPDHSSIIEVALTQKQDTLLLQVSNRDFRGMNKNVPGMGLGVENTRKRLKHFFGDSYKLDITHADGNYVVHLLIAFK